MTPKTEWAAATDVGLVRDHNEDAFFVDEAAGIGFVADGMGGHDAGEVASALAVETVRREVAAGSSLADALIQAHKAIVAHPNGGGHHGMGTTGVAVRVEGNQVEVAWVGDSRAYLFDGEQVYALTKDHTPVQEWVSAGRLSADDARRHPRRNEISQALGVGNGYNRVEPSTARAYFGRGSVVLLCSDGLTEHLSDADLKGTLAQGTRPLEGAARRLIQAALQGGGTDNITVVLVKALA